MLACVGIFFVSSLIALYEVPLMLKKQLLKECFVFSLLLITGTSLSMALVLQVPLPNPTDWMMMIFKPISDWIDDLLK